MSADKHNKNNKGLLRLAIVAMLLLVSVSAASAQSYIGFRAGGGTGSARFVPEQETVTVFGLLSGGVSYKYFSDLKFVGAVEADVQYFERGYKYDLAKDSDSSYMRTINSIDLPIMWHPHIYVMNRNARVFMNLGMNLTYNIDSYEKYVSKENGTYSEGEYDMLLIRDNRWGYGLVAGFGVSFFWERLEFTAEARYYYGYSDVLKNYTKYPDNPMRSPLDNMNISFGISYRLGQGGIKSAPSAHHIERMEAKALENMNKVFN